MLILVFKSRCRADFNLNILQLFSILSQPLFSCTADSFILTHNSFHYCWYYLLLLSPLLLITITHAHNYLSHTVTSYYTLHSSWLLHFLFCTTILAAHYSAALAFIICFSSCFCCCILFLFLALCLLLDLTSQATSYFYTRSCLLLLSTTLTPTFSYTITIILTTPTALDSLFCSLLLLLLFILRNTILSVKEKQPSPQAITNLYWNYLLVTLCTTVYCYFHLLLTIITNYYPGTLFCYCCY